MEKTINIGGKDVKFKFTLSAFYIFKNQFSYDAMNKIVPTIGEILSNLDFSIFEAYEEKEEEKEKENKEALTGGEVLNAVGRTLESTYNFEMVDFLNLLWAFAKNADGELPNPEIWFSTFDEFPIFDVMREFVPVLLESLGSKKKLVKKNTEMIKTETVE